MKGWLNKAWHDPVGSKVISGIILALLGAVALWAKAGFSSSLAVIWASTEAIWTWLSSTVSLPIWIMLLTLITFPSVIGLWLIEERSRAVKQVSDRSAQHILTILDDHRRATEELNNSKREIAERLHASEIARERAELELATYKQQLFEASHAIKFDATAIRVLKHIFSQYPNWAETHSISGQLRIPYAATETACNDLKKAGMVRRPPQSYTSPSRGWTLTDDGRDYCVKSGSDFGGV
jgi:hypothetical protein